MFPQVMNVNRAFTKLTINHLRSAEIVSSVFRRQCEGRLNTWSVLCNREKSHENVADSEKKNVAVSVTEGNVLYERGLIEEKKSKAMRSYLERAQKYNAFMTRQREEYHNGKRHLANMMGADPDTFTQEDVDAAIEYLFPSGLFVPAARPFMKPPEHVFPPKKDAEFDDSGRPFHSLFYTGKPNFYQLLHDFGVHLANLNDYEDKMIRKNLQPDPNVRIELSGSVWTKKQDLELRMVEVISDREYENLICLLERIVSHPYVYNIKNEIIGMRTPLMNVSMDFSKPPEPSYDNNGRAFVVTEACPRKSARATVTVRYPGTGKIEINGEDITYFDNVQSREQILFPLHLSNMLNQVDVEATVSKGGTSGQAGAIRYGISWGLRSFVNEDTIERMRLAGLLTRDFRTKERKKPGQWRARRKYTWKKR